MFTGKLLLLHGNKMSIQSNINYPIIRKMYKRDIPSEISRHQWNNIFRFIERNIEEWSKNPLRSFKVKRNADLPLSLLVMNRKVTKVLIFFKGESRQIGEGGQRVAKQAFDIYRGCYVVYKPPLAIEKKLYSVLPQAPELARVYGFYSYYNKDNVKKYIMLEKKYDKNLKFLLHRTLKTQELYPIFMQLLTGLKHMHESTLGDTPCCHFDLKLSNIFCTLTKDGKVDQVAIADLGMACRSKHIGGTYKNFSPEYAALVLKSSKYSASEKVAFHKNYGEKIDIFALGLLLADLPTSKVNSGLNCLAVKFFYSDKRQLKKNAHISQKKIDRELAHFTKRVLNPDRLKLWEVVKGCLRVDPEERISLDEAIAILSE